MIKGSRRFLMSVAAGCAVVAASAPAYANSASAAVDMTGKLHGNSQAGSVVGSGDGEFSSLFQSWQRLDGDTPVVASSATSIPTLKPVQDYRMTSSYGMRFHPVLRKRKGHDGVDLAGPIGTPIRATADGVIGTANWRGGYGLFIRIEHGGNMETRYGHMSRLNVAEGQTVRKGDVIGYMGSTGRSTGSHLHYEVRINDAPVNPLPFMYAANLVAPGSGAEVQQAALDSVEYNGQGGDEE